MFIEKSSRKMAFLLLVQFLLLIGTFEVKSQGDLPCNEATQASLACPEMVCKIMNSRNKDFCKDIHCEGITPEDCRESDSLFESGLTMCGCCPGCAKYLKAGDECEVSPPDPTTDPTCTDPFCPILKNRCEPPLVCKYLGENSKVCAVDTSAPDLDARSCEDRRNLGLSGALHWIPNCDEDGSYSPKQCKGTKDDGICFCAARDGTRIFGTEWRGRSENQTCACSRQVYSLRCQGNLAAIHCSSDGNYEPLQCDIDSGLCYCVEPQTGQLTGAVLPEHRWQELPCYSLNVTNWDPTGSYLRICESEWVAGEKLRKEARLHGLNVLSGRDLICDYDGAFGPMRRNMGLMYCVDRMGELSQFRQDVQLPMNCQCYRDSFAYTGQGRNFLKTCHDPTGDYNPTDTIDHHEGAQTVSCVDKDGIFFGDIVPIAERCCLLGDCPIEPPTPTCDNPATIPRIKYKRCDEWPKEIINPRCCDVENSVECEKADEDEEEKD